MMKSVALLDSIPSHDDDFVLVDHTGQTDDEDNDSFDFCEDALSLSSSAQHQATILTATSNPLQVVQENFFVPKQNNNSCDNENNNNNGDHPTEVNPLNLNSSLLPNQVLEEGDGDPSAAAKTDAPLLTTTSRAASLETLTVIASNEEEELSSFLASSASQILSEQDDSAPFAVEPPPLSKHGQDLDVTHLTTAVQQDLGIVEQETRNCGPSESKDKASVVDYMMPMQTQQDGAGSVADEFDVSPLSIVAALSSLSNQQDSSVIGSAKKGGNHESEQVVNQTEEDGSQTTSSSSRAPSSSTSSKSITTASSPNNNNNNSRVEKKKRRKQLKLAKKAAAAAAAAAALGQFTALKAKASPKRKKGKKVANIAVAEAVKSHQEYNQTHLLGKTSTNKKLR